MRNFSITAFLIISLPILGQQTPNTNDSQELTTVKLDPVYFILGTLSDYMGRFTYVNKESQIDSYYPFEKPLIELLESIITNDLNLKVSTIPDNLVEVSLYETFSPELSLVLNSFFNKTHLITDSLKNKPEFNHSYLTGRYYRYGEKINDSIYKIQLANSGDHKVCDSLLRRVGCTKIHFKYLRNIPAQFIYYFIPTSGLKNYLNYIENEKVKLQDSFNEYLKSRMKFDDQMLRKLDESERKKREGIIELFKNNGL